MIMQLMQVIRMIVLIGSLCFFSSPIKNGLQISN
jgi:hypothetical protein